ncbi:TMhelix containing protein [Vibrio phage 1.101.O._10N.261.45.C6]|nr:TMhelix containing protein [Vibrio phage 1.101.O._10N.261.45.C6]
MKNKIKQDCKFSMVFTTLCMLVMLFAATPSQASEMDSKEFKPNLEQSIVKAEKRLLAAVQRQNERMAIAIAKRQLTCKKENK